MPPLQLPPLPTFLSLNVNGLRDAGKRRSLFAALLSGPWRVIVLVETHSADDLEVSRWVQEGAGPGMPWQGLGFWSHGAARCQGVAVLVHHACVVDMLGWRPSVAHSDSGRVLAVAWTPPSTSPPTAPLTIMGVYAPVLPGERRAFLGPAGPLAAGLAAASGASAVLMVGGDFNCVPDARDVFGDAGPRGGGRMVGSMELNSSMAAHGLVDAWRHHNAALHEFTHIAAHGGGMASGGRIDMCFVPAHLVARGWLASCKHLHGRLPGDHAAVEARLRDPEAPPEGPAMWRFPVHLLQAPGFVDSLRAAVQQAATAWAPATPAAAAAPAGQRWEAVKATIRMFTLQRVQQQRAADRQAEAARAALLRWSAQALRPGHSMPAAAACAAYRARVGAEQARLQQEADSRHLATTALWRRYGEQGTRFFHRVGKLPAPRVPMVAVNPPGGARVSLAEHGKPAMDAAIAAHFVGPHGVFSQPTTCPAAAQQVLGSITRTVPANLHALMDGPGGDGSITAACLVVALKGCPPGKSPGSDGLPYELYAAVGDTLFPLLAAACNEALGAGPAGALPGTLRTGVITLLHKGGDKPADALASFRPITLLNADYKLVARVLVTRLTPLVDAVTDPTQTAFVPGRWIGDNVLQHLEEVDYCQDTGTPGCILFLDFTQAYDRLAREWLYACMEHMGFPALAVQWVRLMLHGTQARVRYHGWHTPLMQVPSGVAQGSPLSPLLWVLAAQPLSAHMQQLQTQGAFGGITMPDGTLAPPCHQHADDTSLHVDTRASALAALTHGVRPFEAASNSCLNLGKCTGMELGSPAPFAGVDAATGVRFPAAGDGPIRHLGILLSHDREAAAAAMYAQRLRGVYAAIRHWSSMSLTYLGRLHVAKAVLASMVWYHATFVQPPPAALKAISAAIGHYVSAGVLVEGLGPLQGRPPGAATEALHRTHGGLGRVDVPSQVRALQAKVAAMLLHPRRHPWKVLMSNAFKRAFPSLGVAALVSRCQPCSGSGVGLGPRRLAYWRALAAVLPFRSVSPGRLTAGHVRAERLLHNACIVSAAGAKLSSLPGPLPNQCVTVGDLAACLASDSPPVAAAAQRVFACLPVPWQEHACGGPSRAPVWEVSACGGWARQWRAPAGQLPFAVLLDGRLAPAAAPPQGLPAWLPAAVAFAPCPRAVRPLVALQHGGGHLHRGLDVGNLQPYLLGQWDQVPVDPNVWAVGACVPLSHFTVCGARERLLHIAVRALGRGYAPGEGVRPRAWPAAPAADSGLQEWERHMQQQFDRRLAGQRAGGARRSHAAMEPDFSASWMSPSPSRLLPLDRAAAGHQAEQQAAAARRDSDGHDAVALVPRQREWGRAYALLWDASLSREQSHFAWRLLHLGLLCGAAALPGVPADAGLDGVLSCCCGAAACSGARPGLEATGPSASASRSQPQLENYTHMFWACPAVSAAVRWLWGVWRAISGGEPPWAASTLLLGTWQPATAAQQRLWQHLRVGLLHAVWQLRQRRWRTGQQHDAAAVVALTCATLETAIRADFAAATSDLPASAGLGPEWFRSRVRGVATLSAFTAMWGQGGVLASVSGGGQLVVSIPRALPPVSLPVPQQPPWGAGVS